MLYLRQSVFREESVSLEQQESVCRDYCARRGYLVVAVESDAGVSASKTKLARRRGVQAAFEHVDEDRAELIVAWKGSRVARNRLDAELARERVASAGGRIESATEPNETTAAGRFTTGVLAEVDAFQAMQIGEDWRMTHARRRKAGVPAQGGRRYGYVRVRDEQGRVTKYEQDPTQSLTLRWMYEQVVAGHGGLWIATELNRQGLPNPVGRLWSAKRVLAVLDSGFGAGLIVHEERDNANRKIRDPVFHPGAHKPVIDEETWEAYRRTRRLRSALPPRVVEPRYVLSGLIRCGDCGSAMWAMRSAQQADGQGVAHGRRPRNGGAGHSYICGRWQRTRDVRCVTVVRHRAEAAVLDWLGSVAHDVAAAAAADEAMQRKSARAQRSAMDAARRVSALEAKLAKLTRAWVDDQMDATSYAAVRDELTEELKVAQDEAEAAQPIRPMPVAAAATATMLLDKWDLLPVLDRRNVLQGLVARVEVHPPAQRGGRASVVVVPVWDA